MNEKIRRKQTHDKTHDWVRFNYLIWLYTFEMNTHDPHGTHGWGVFICEWIEQQAQHHWIEQ